MIAAAFLIVAILYAAVGHGGASGYLAVMSLAGFPPSARWPSSGPGTFRVVAHNRERQRGGHRELHFPSALLSPAALAIASPKLLIA